VILAVGKQDEILAGVPDSAERIDANGMYIAPGFVCAHGHFYGLYSRGMGLIDESPKAFLEVLERLWWRLDRALDGKSNYMGAKVLTAEALKCGTTCIVDHHASPDHITGSLDELAQATLDCGARACLCYEVTDRNGMPGAKEGIQENIRFMRKCATEKNPQLGATFGLHAPFTCCDETLKESVEEVEKFRKEFPDVNAGFHIHVAEGAHDEEESVRVHGMRCIPRLEKLGLLGENTIVGHGVFLDDDELDAIARTRTNIVTNPESNQNNAVGIPRVAAMVEKGICVGLGTDGMSYDMLQEYRSSCLIHKLEARDPRVGTMDSFNMLFRNNSLIASKFFAHPVGRLEPGCFADIILINYHSPTALTAGNLPWQLHFGVSTCDVHTVFVGGKKVCEEGKILAFDFGEMMAESRTEVCPDVWKRFAGIVEKETGKK
jgi:putative selenium metabolism protein SsnA